MLAAYGYPIAQFFLDAAARGGRAPGQLGGEAMPDDPTTPTIRHARPPLAAVGQLRRGRRRWSSARCSASSSCPSSSARMRARPVDRDLPRARASPKARPPTASRSARPRAAGVAGAMEAGGPVEPRRRHGPSAAPRSPAQVCVACHGENGVSPTPELPSLAGQTAAAIYKQLHDYRTGARVHPQMTPVAKQLIVTDLAHAAVYFAAASTARRGTRRSRDQPADIEIVRLATEGDSAPPHPGLQQLPRQRIGRPDRNAGADRPAPRLSRASSSRPIRAASGATTSTAGCAKSPPGYPTRRWRSSPATIRACSDRARRMAAQPLG